MCERILAFCGALGFTARIAVAGTTGAAHALARFGGEPLILCPSGREAEALAPMPLAALRLDEDVLGRAARLGLERIGELHRHAARARSSAGSARTCSPASIRRSAAPPSRSIRSFPKQPPSVLLRFMEPIASAEAIAEAAGEAVRRLVPDLAEAGLGVRRLVLACDRVDNDVQMVTIGTARATRDGAHLARLLCAEDRDDRARLRHRARCASSPPGSSRSRPSRSTAGWTAASRRPISRC